MNKKKQCRRVLSFIDKTPWAIRPDALEKIISIASRTYSDPQLVSLIKSERSLSVINNDDITDIAVIDVIGPIFTRADLFSDVSGATSIEMLERQLDDALYDDSIRAIVLRIDSPGGEVTGTHELANYIDEACELKPIIAYVQGAACSAAYWIASATGRIYADKTATLGSIGVVATWTDDSAARAAAGLTDYEVVSSQSPNKRLDPTRDDGRAELQKQIDGLADIFIDDVAAFRDVTRDKVMSNFGQGGIFLADEAVMIGMADEVSNFRDVIAKLSTENTNNINGVPNMGVKAKRDKQNFSLKASGRASEDDELDKQGADDIEDDRQSADEDEKDLDAEDDDNDKLDESDDDDFEDEKKDDDEESPAAKKAINALARKQPNLYRAIIKRGARRERNRIASIDDLNIVGHNKLIRSAKYHQQLTAEQTSYAVLRAEQQQRSKLSDGYAADAGYRVPVSTGTASKEAMSDEKSFLQNVAAGARALLNGGKR
ncbi:S49 family peptidase [Gilliamella sp. CG16]|uniref:S49 family peptidase n=1 Tax=Gilliamella sp. CG16 TaxID=3351503 RepID=UPI0039881927